jgi:hypothetical protein
MSKKKRYWTLYLIGWNGASVRDFKNSLKV